MTEELKEAYDGLLHYVQAAGNDETYEYYEQLMKVADEYMNKINKLEGVKDD